MTTQDRRIRRTQQALAKALITLTLEQGYDSITIRDITERADVGYATFFRHYSDKDALLHDVLDVVLNELTELLPALDNDIAPDTLGALLFRYVQGHSELVRVLLSNHGLIKRIIEAGSQNMLNKRLPLKNGLVPAEIASYHLVAASVAMIQWWLDHDMPYPAERMGIFYRELITRPTRQVAFQN